MFFLNGLFVWVWAISVFVLKVGFGRTLEHAYYNNSNKKKNAIYI